MSWDHETTFEDQEDTLPNYQSTNPHQPQPNQASRHRAIKG